MCDTAGMNQAITRTALGWLAAALLYSALSLLLWAQCTP
jgi:hypothetical protein